MSPLLQVFREPDSARSLEPERWNRLLREARAEHLAARLGWYLADRGQMGLIPARAREILDAARHHPELLQAEIRFELHKVRKALAETGTELLLLKGAAYMLRGLALSRGRPLADLDVLVPREKIDRVERALIGNGWESVNIDRYDQRYYRRWMHEIPPLRHRDRGIEVDVHHNILPLTGRLRPDAARLWQASVPLDEPGLRTLCPTDMVLHSAAHLFQDEIGGHLRDLVDLHEMLSEFGTEDGFWDRLAERAAELDLGRPLYYATDSTRHLLATPVPTEHAVRIAERFAPPSPIRTLMRWLIGQALTPRGLGDGPRWPADWLLYIRSHWLRMPPGLLISHLARKSWRRARSEKH